MFYYLAGTHYGIIFNGSCQNLRVPETKHVTNAVSLYGLDKKEEKYANGGPYAYIQLVRLLFI